MANLEDEIRDKLTNDALSLSGSFDFGRWSQHSQAANEEPTSATIPSELEHASSVPRVLVQSIILGARIADSDDLQSGPQIGQGTSMIVHEGLLDGQAVAIKKCRLAGANPASRQMGLMSLHVELRVLMSDFIKPHPNIVDLIAVSWVEETQSNGEAELLPLLVMELATPEARTLHDLLPTIDPLDFRLKEYLISDIISGLDAIHSDRFIHGDLKPENVLIFRHRTEDRYTAKLADFGFSDDVEQLPFGVEDNPAGGTDYWNAPECLDHDVDLKACRRPSRDLYSFGLVAWYVVASELPFGADRGLEWAAAYDGVTALKLRDGVASDASKFFCGRSGRLGLDLKSGWGEVLRRYLGGSNDKKSGGLTDVDLSVGVLDEMLWRSNVRSTRSSILEMDGTRTGLLTGFRCRGCSAGSRLRDIFPTPSPSFLACWPRILLNAAALGNGFDCSGESPGPAGCPSNFNSSSSF
jgi:serine/threonine protein kinase